MYPETKGVPLEEMDAVFGEGALSLCLCSLELHLTCSIAEEREEAMDYEDSEVASFVSHSQQSDVEHRRPSNNQGSKSNWFMRVLKGPRRSDYEPIGGP